MWGVGTTDRWREQWIVFFWDPTFLELAFGYICDALPAEDVEERLNNSKENGPKQSEEEWEPGENESAYSRKTWVSSAQDPLGGLEDD